MRIDELTRPPTQLDAAQILRKAGYAPLGTGHYATVWRKASEPYVLKLYASYDKGYETFIQMAQAKPNQHFPVVRSKPIQITEKYNAVRIEFLPLPPQSLWKLIEQCGEHLGNLQMLDEGVNPKITLLKIKWFTVKNRSLAEAIDLIYHGVIKTDSVNMINDIGLTNSGMRGNTLVFTDPVGWGGESMSKGFDLLSA